MESIENQNHRTSFEFSSRMEDRGWICKYANNFRATTANLVSSGGWRGCSSGGRSHGALARESTLPRSIDEPRSPPPYTPTRNRVRLKLINWPFRCYNIKMGDVITS